MDDIWKVIAELGIELHPDRIATLSRAISGMRSLDDFDETTIGFGFESHRSLVSKLVDAWHKNKELNPLEVAAALRAASRTEAIIRERENIQLVWSGPDTKLVPIRRTEQVLVELINKAFERLFLVSFVAYGVQPIMDALKSALGRDVRLSILVESSESHGGKISVDSVEKMKVALKDAEIYIWQPSIRERDDTGAFGSVHAKCAVADGKVAFITSANLTEAALERNMELGVLFNGGIIPDKLDRHFEALINTRIIEPV